VKSSTPNNAQGQQVIDDVDRTYCEMGWKMMLESFCEGNGSAESGKITPKNSRRHIFVVSS
jgi:hypothetical protein